MTKVWYHFGDISPDYLSLGAAESVVAGGRELSVKRLVLAEQVHGDHIHICNADDLGAGFGGKEKVGGADGLITAMPQQYLVIRTADCFPVFVFDPSGKAIAALHSGREGTRLNIVGKAIGILKESFGCDPAELCAYIGAGICERHYEVGTEMYEEFVADIRNQGFSHRAEGRKLNLRMVIFQQLINSGLSFYNIENIQECTHENEAYFSYRRDKGENRQINIIGIIDE